MTAETVDPSAVGTLAAAVLPKTGVAAEAVAGERGREGAFGLCGGAVAETSSRLPDAVMPVKPCARR